MFRVIKNVNLPLSPDNISTVETQIDLWNPLKNPWTHPENGYLTENMYWRVIRSLWTRENILENFRAYFFNSGLRSLEDPEAIFQHIPDHLIYCFSFLQLQFTPNIRNNLKFTWSKPVRMWVRGRYTEHEYTYEAQRTSAFSYRSENWATEILPEFETIHTRIEQFLANHGHLQFGFYTRPHVQNNSWVWQYAQYVSNGIGVSDASGTMLDNSRLLTALNADPDAILRNISANPANECYPQLMQVISKRNKAALYTVFNYSTSPLNMLQWPLVAKGEHKPPLYGIELEMSTDYSVQDLVDASDEPFFIIKNDSSVSGNKRYAYEMVTVPMSYKAHKKQWAWWFSNLDYNKFDCTKDTTNGMHVHVGLDTFVSEKHKTDFAWFFTQPSHQDFMTAFSERTPSSMNAYAPMPNYRAQTPVGAYKETVRRCQDKRGTISWSNKSTIEVRLFRGIVSLADVLKNLEFVDSIFYFTMDEKNVSQLNLKNYFKWLRTTPKNKYSILKKYFDTNTKLNPLIEQSTLLEAIFNEKNPDKIMQIVEKKKLNITMDSVTLLNKRFKKRVFVLDKVTGKLALNMTNRSPIAFLDRMVQARILGLRKVAPVVPPPTPQESLEETISTVFDEVHIDDPYPTLDHLRTENEDFF